MSTGDSAFSPTARAVFPIAVARVRIIAFLFLSCLCSSLTATAASVITYVQSNSAVPQSSPTSVTVPFTGAQTAGNLNVVVVGWNSSTATVSSVTDTKGNIYVRAVGPTVVSNFLSQSIYYAKNILAAGAGANTVTVQFAAAAAFPDIRILEYSGADLANPVDVTAAASGNSTSTNSGSVTTTNATDLLFGANIVLTHSTGPGTGFTQRIITNPDGDIAEDRMVTAIGTYNATAPINPSGRWIMQMVAFRTPLAGGDTTPPTAPTGLTATAASGTQVNLAWTASTDNVGVTGYRVERCQGAGCNNFAQIATPNTTTYNDTGLTNGTSYSYRVRATDAAGNLSGYSNVATASTPDTQAPTAPTGLSATAASQTQINLSWTASTDNVGVTQYLIESCQGAGCTVFAQIGTANGTTFSNTGLTAGTSYSYRVRATDAAGNLSGYSTVANATTLTAQDTQPPTAPSNLAATSSGPSQIDLSWTGSTDDVGVTNYLIERCQGTGCTTFTQVGTSTLPSYSDLGLLGSTSYSYRVRATDAANNLSSYSNTADATTGVAGLPTFVAETHSATDGQFNSSTLTMNVTGTNNILIAAWHAEFDGGLPDSWTVTCNGVPGTTIIDTDGYTGGAGNRRFRIYYWLNPQPGTNTIIVSNPYTGANELAVSVILLTGVSQGVSLGAITADVSTADRTGESETVNTTVNDLVVHVIADALLTRGTLGAGETSVSIANDGLHPQDGDASLWLSTKPGAPNSTTVSSSGWASRVINGVGIVVHGVPSGSPTNLTATAVSSSQINLSWTPPVGFTVANYLIERCLGGGCTTFAQIGTSINATFNDTGLAASTTYSYQVRATDGSGNFTAYSNVASATTAAAADTQPPTAPSNLTAGAVSGTQINLSWAASTDNVGVTNYFVEQCQGSGCSVFSQIGSATGTAFSATGLTAGTSYSYRVRATDGAGNLSGYSNIATATTQSPDTQPPTAPTNLAATATSGTQINLSWTASTDNVGVTAYLLERCQGASCSNFTQIATPSGTTFSNAGLTPGTSYSYRVRATDAAGNLSAYSNVASATTQAGAVGLVAAYGFDEGSGTTVTDFSGQGNTGTLVNATWAATGKFGKALQFNGTNALVTVPDAASLHLTNGMTLEAWVNPSTVSSKWRDVIYKGGNDNYLLEGTTNHSSAPGGGATLGTTDLIIFGTAPLVANTWAHLAVTYDGAALRFYVNGSQVSTQAITGAILQSNTSLQIGGDTFFSQYFAGMIDEVRVYNVALTAAQIQTDMATQVSTPDTQPPTTPTNLTATAVSQNQINLSWTASIDNIAVSQYLIESCQGVGCSNFAQVGTSTTTTFSHTGLTPAASYSYRVRATDAAGNLSGYSNVTSTTTQSPDTQPPTTPTNLTATAVSGNQINLSWNASTDNVGVTGYLIERCQGAGCNNFGRLFTVTGTTYSDTALVSNTSYTYQVKATDAAGNFSPYSNTATATTLNTISGLVAAYSFDEGAGTVVNDLSGNGNNGTVVNATWSAAGKYGNALSFNGTSARVTVNDSGTLHLTSGMTLEAWVNPTTVTSAWRDVIYKGGNDNYLLEGTTNHSAVPGGGATVGSTDLIAFGTAPLTVNAWTHLAVTYDGASIRFYVNGLQIASQGITGAILESNSQLQIGGDSVFGQYFAGLIDEVRVYNIALTPTQIQADMAIPVSGGTSPLVSLSPATVTFGSQQTGTTSAPQPVTLTNIGNSVLSISSIAMSGGNAADFAQTNNCGSSVTVGGSCVINVTFTPTTTGSRISSLTINDNAPGSPHTVPVSGTGTGFQVNPRVAVLTFKQTQQFTASGSVTWSVDGVVGGNATSGTITQTGLYTPPSVVGTHTVTAAGTQTASSTVYVVNNAGTFTYHNDNLRTGVNSSEVVLNPTNVTSAQFGKLFSYPIDGWAFASPLYVANVAIPNQGFHNVVYLATEHDTVYAYDADGLSSNPLWQVSFLGPGVTTMPCVDVGECGDIPNEIGITGTPTIDQTTGTMYVVAKTKEGTNYVQRLHALDITTGAERFGGPVVIQASVPGTGLASSGGTLPFDPFLENQRPGLLLNNGVVYIAFASHGDQAPWHGWVIGYNATTLQRTMAWSVSPNGYGGGIWQSGAGLATDATGNIYFTTGNGDFNANTGGPDYGDSVVKLGPSGTVVDYFTPFDQGIMESQNVELSSAGPVLLIDQPGATPHRLVTAAKTGTIYVVNRDNMGHFQSGSDSQIIQSLPGVLPHGGQEEGNYSAPAFFNGNIYYGAVKDNLKIFRFTNGVLSSTPVSQSAVTYPNRGASFAVSANGTSNGILWAVQDNTPSTGVLRAYDANNVGTELYNTTQAGTRDSLGFATKFSIPLVVNGKVFVVSTTQITAYGLLP